MARHLFRTASIASSFFLLLQLSAAAQPATNFTQFFLNPYTLNPSYAGIDGQPALSLLYRNQWIGVDGAPTTAMLSLHAPLKDRVGGGIQLANESLGFFRHSKVLFSVAYHLPLQDETWLRFGLSAGGTWNTVDLRKLQNVNDQALANILDKSASLSGNAGISLRHRTLHVGVALPALFSPSYVTTRSFAVEEVKPFQSLVLHASNRFYFNANDYIFEPFAVYYINQGLPSQWELGGVLQLNHVVWTGVSYRQHYGISAMGGIKLKNTLALGASYSLKQTGYDEINSPGFEISIGYLFGKPYRKAPVYSFVNAVKPRQQTTPRPAVASNKESSTPRTETSKPKPTEKTPSRVKPKDETPTEEKVDQEETRLAVEDRQAVEPPVEEAYAEAPETIAAVGLPSEEAQVEPRPIGQDAQISPESQSSDVAPSLSPVVASTVRHDRLQRGDHPQELAVGHYVAAGAFITEDNAVRFATGLRNLGYNAGVGYSSQHASWYVYVVRTRDLAYALHQQQRVKEAFLLRDAWLLTVE